MSPFTPLSMLLVIHAALCTKEFGAFTRWPVAQVAQAEGSDVIRVFPSCFSVPSDACGFGPIIGEVFSEPWVLEGSFGGYPLPGVVDEYFAEEVQEELVENGIWGNNVLLQVRLKAFGVEGQLTLRCFMALTYFLEALVVS